MALTFCILQVYNNIETALIRTFAGPADKGVPSPSVQETLYKMVS